MPERHVDPTEVAPEAARRILDFLNAAGSPEEVGRAVEIPDERDVGVGVGRRILARRDELGGFTDLRQVAEVPYVGPERFTEIVVTLGTPTVESMSDLVPQIQGFRRIPLELVGGVGGVLEVLAYRDGSDTRVRVRPGTVEWGEITVRRTGVGAPVLWRWWREIVDGGERRRNVTVLYVDDRGETIASWTLHGCWPADWRMVRITRASGDQDFVEQMTLTVEDVVLD